MLCLSDITINSRNWTKGYKTMKKGIFFILAAAVIFSSMEVSVKVTGGAFNSIQLNFLRFLIGGAVLFPMARRQLKENHYRLQKKDIAIFALTGFTCVIISMTLYILSVSFVSATVAAILFSCNTFFSIVFAGIFLKENVPRPVLVALLICVVGVIAIINPFHFTGSLAGIVIGLGSAITFGLHGVLGKKLTGGKAISGNVLTCFSFLFGGAELGVLMGFTHVPVIADALDTPAFKVFSRIPYFSGIRVSNIFMLLVISVMVTGAGFACYFIAIDTTSVTMASLVFFIKPVLSPIIAFIVLGDVAPAHVILGIVFIVIGSVIIFASNMLQQRTLKKVVVGIKVLDTEGN